MILVSACLAGVKCRYDGKDNLIDEIKKLVEEGKALPVCPEQLGGLTTPRKCNEIRGNQVISSEEDDVTKAFKQGALYTLAIAKASGCKVAIMKAKSPSCGCGMIYDGTFSRHLIEGDGITTQLLKKNNIEVYTENNYSKHLKLTK